MTKHVFPFNAVVGQEQAKLALTLAAINPKIGGVLISGPRGTAKSTLARGFAHVLPANHEGVRPFVNMPLGTAEDRLVGSLDLEKVIGDGQVEFKPGLLKQAHEGVLYVDEVNLLPDHLVDHLLDVSASGVNHVEREGVSHEHPAEFLLVGTMNPDEGELRPQLLDRFGLMVEISDEFTVEERIQAVKIRELFEDHPETFLEQFSAIDQQYAAQMAQATMRLGQIEMSDALRVQIAERCVEARVDGLRADIVWTRAAIAHAAWRGDVQVQVADLEAVEVLVLNSRRTSSDSVGSSGGSDSGRQNSSSSKQSSSPYKRPEDSIQQNRANSRSQSQFQFQSKTQSQPKSSESEEVPAEHESRGSAKSKEDSGRSSSLSDWGQILPQNLPKTIQPRVGLFEEVKTLLQSVRPHKKYGLSESEEFSSRSSRRRIKSSSSRTLSANLIGSRETKKGSVDWFNSLLSSKGRWPISEIRFKKRRQAKQVIHQVLIDTSGSGFQGDGQSSSLASALGFLKALSKDAYLKREGFSLIGFGNNEVKALGEYIRSPKAIEALLDGITAGGGTPLGEAISRLKATSENLIRKYPELTLVNYVLSDGRSRASLEGLSLPGKTVWIDTEQSKVKRGFGQLFAEELGANYLSAFHPMNTIA